MPTELTMSKDGTPRVTVSVPYRLSVADMAALLADWHLKGINGDPTKVSQFLELDKVMAERIIRDEAALHTRSEIGDVADDWAEALWAESQLWAWDLVSGWWDYDKTLEREKARGERAAERAAEKEAARIQAMAEHDATCTGHCSIHCSSEVS